MKEFDYLKTNKFDSEIQFKEFEKKLDDLVFLNKLTLLNSEVFDDISFKKYKDLGNNIYCLSEPDLYWRGFFLDYDSALKYIKTLKEKEKRNSYGCIALILGIVLIAIIFIIFKKSQKN